MRANKGVGLVVVIAILMLLQVQAACATTDVAPQALTVYVSANPWTGPAPLKVSFDCIVTGGKEPFSYTWFFGDGTTGYEKSMVHTYNNPGMYLARLYVIDANKEEGTATTTILVTPPNAPLDVRINAAPTSGNAPLTVSFQAFVSGGTAPFSYSWIFGDGGTGSQVVETHIYSSQGTYYASCTVTDSSNPKQTKTSRNVRIDVQQGGGQLIVFADGNPKNGPAPLTVDFYSKVSGGQPPYKFAWEFGDGGMGSGETVQYTYNNPGQYKAFLTVMDSAGNSGVSQPILINVGMTQPLIVVSSASPTKGIAPLTVTFTGSAIGGVPPYAFVWDFGDGQMDNKPNTAYTYTAPGTYYATLVATDSSQPPNSGKAPSIMIQVDPAPGNIKVVSSASPTSGSAPLSVNFRGYASGGTSPYTYTWNFGDGSTGSTNNLTHTYVSGGTFAAVLSARDTRGYTGAAPPIIITVTIPPLTVYVSASPTSGIVPLTVSFTSSASGGTPPYSYMWDFGDGGAASQPNPVYTYFTPGLYYAKLTVTDSGWPPQTATSVPIQIRVDPTPTQIKVDVKVSPTSGNAPLTVDFWGVASGGTAPYTYTWIFGDGSTSSNPSTSHIYTTPGTYQTYLRAMDSKGYVGTSEIQVIYVFPSPLSVTFTASPTVGYAPLTVTFDSTVSGGMQPYAYFWDFGDNGTSNIADPVHTYFIAGTYYVYLRVYDASNQSAQAGPKTITVNQTTPTLVVSGTASPTSGFAPLNVNFMGTVSGGTPPYTYKWVFGDGNVSASKNTSHTYISPGTYTAFFQAWDSASHTGYSNQTTIYVWAQPLVVTIDGSPKSGQAPLTVSFVSHVTGGQPAYYYYWDFGDGGNSQSANPTHTYATAGTYSVYLLVYDIAGHNASAGPLAITVTPPNNGITVDISANPTKGIAPLSVYFQETVKGGKTPYKLEWTFGDGGTSSSSRPTHVYVNPGSYQAYLKAWDANGTYGYSSPVNIDVAPAPLMVTISGSPTSGNVPLTVAFASKVSGGTQPYSYSWTFGDGGTSTMSNPVHTYFTSGKFTVGLQLTDSSGMSATSNPLTIEVKPTTANLIVVASGTPTSGYVPLTVSFQGYASNGTRPYTYTFVFGDGNKSYSNNVTHKYAYAGTFTAYLLAYDVNNNVGYSTPITITVLNGGGQLIANAYATPSSGPAPLSVNFTGSATGGTPPYSYAWTFGDGNTGIGSNAKHVYVSPGNYMAYLTVTDSAGGSAKSASILIQVKPKGQFKVTVSATPTSGASPLTVSFTSQVQGGSSPFQYTWAFGDGGVSSQTDPVYTYTNPGTFDATLTVEDSTGKMNMSSVKIVVTGIAKLASVTVTPTSWSMKVGETKIFSVKAFDTDGKDVTSATFFNWIVTKGLGSLNRSTGQTTTFVAGKPGNETLQVQGTYYGEAKAVAARIAIQNGTPPPWVLPKVFMTKPAEGDTVKGAVNVSGYTLNGVAKVSKVSVKIDNDQWVNATLYSSTGNRTDWAYLWDTSYVIVGQMHTVRARAWDGSFNSTDAIVNVTVIKDSVPPPPTNPSFEIPSWLIPLLILIAIAMVVAIAYLLYRRRAPVKTTPSEEIPETRVEETVTEAEPEAAESAFAPPASRTATVVTASALAADRMARRREAIRRARERRQTRQAPAATTAPPPPPPQQQYRSATSFRTAPRTAAPPPPMSTTVRPAPQPTYARTSVSPRDRLDRIRARRESQGGTGTRRY